MTQPDEQADQDSTTPGGVTDFHNHVIPAVDDGASDEAESRSALEAFRAAGVRGVIASPHLDASIAARPDRLAARMGVLDAGWERLHRLAADAFPDLDVRRGAEVKLDTPEPDFTDDRFRLAGGPFVLCEFPYFSVPPRSTRVLAAVRAQGWIPVIAHPERYAGMQQDAELIPEWRTAGAYLQLNGPSLLGRYGNEARDMAFTILEHGWADYVCSDYHARGRPEVVTYRAALAEIGGQEQADLLTVTNPGRLLNGEPPLAVSPMAGRRGFWERITSAFR